MFKRKVVLSLLGMFAALLLVVTGFLLVDEKLNKKSFVKNITLIKLDLGRKVKVVDVKKNYIACSLINRFLRKMQIADNAKYNKMIGDTGLSPEDIIDYYEDAGMKKEVVFRLYGIDDNNWIVSIYDNSEQFYYCDKAWWDGLVSKLCEL